MRGTQASQVSSIGSMPRAACTANALASRAFSSSITQRGSEVVPLVATIAATPAATGSPSPSRSRHSRRPVASSTSVGRSVESLSSIRNAGSRGSITATASPLDHDSCTAMAAAAGGSTIAKREDSLPKCINRYGNPPAGVVGDLRWE